jgi:NADH-quinone oxidoreductase subunit H
MDATYEYLVRLLPAAAAWPSWLVVAIITALPALACFTFMALGPLVYVYAERKISAFMQDRIGPNRVGPIGLLQTLADTIKLLFKEAIFPRKVDRKLFVIAPILVNVGAFMPFLVIPWGGRLQPADLDVGVFYVVAIASLSTVGLIMAGWASNNKYSLFGGMRSAAQIVSYEIPAVMILLVPVMIAGSLSLQEHHDGPVRGAPQLVPLPLLPLMPIAFLVFFVAGLAETNRAPFDIPEAESELVGGFHTEYSGFFFAMFFMAEYTEMFVLSAVATVLFLGGYLAPHPAAADLPLLVRSRWAGSGCGSRRGRSIFVMMWLRWTLPRSRVDQLMHIAWKVLLPIALVLVVVVGGLVLWPATAGGFPWDRWVGWPLTLGLFAFLLYVMVRAVQWSRRRAGSSPPPRGRCRDEALALSDVWEGFFTVLVGMRITWRHLFTKPVTLQYPSEKWPLPPEEPDAALHEVRGLHRLRAVRARLPGQLHLASRRRSGRPTPRRSGRRTGRRSSCTWRCSTSTCRCAATATCAPTPAPRTAST